jgi:hypothetical protein
MKKKRIEINAMLETRRPPYMAALDWSIETLLNHFTPSDSRERRYANLHRRRLARASPRASRPRQRCRTRPVAAAASDADAEAASARAEHRNLAWRSASRRRTSAE